MLAEKIRLFLLGGALAYQVYADEFVAAAGGCAAVMAVLSQTRAGWERHKVEITQPWSDRGVSRFVLITPDEDGILDNDSAGRALQTATGILICGGNTSTYHRLFASEPLRTIIPQKYKLGVPVAGISAGALLALEICQLTPDETGESELRIVQGLSLVRGFVVGVHFTEWNALPEVLEVMAGTGTNIGYGIDEPACVVCEEGKFARALGQSVFKIEMTDFNKQLHRITRLS